MAGSERHLIKKYANRKLYDTRTSRYITLDGIAQLISEGAEVEVVDRESGRDLTPVILSQIVLSEERRGGQAVNGGSRTTALLGYVRGVLNVPASIVGTEVEKRRGEIETIVDDAIDKALKRLSIPTRREIERMERRLDEINQRLQRERGRTRTPKGATSSAPTRRTRRAGA
jgi:polyhydroxyalkanoate synthesis repressor PhaR